MPTLNINGQNVQVGDEFLQMSPEQQNAAVEEIASKIGATPADAPSFLEGLGRSVATGVPAVGGVLNTVDAATNATLAPVLNGLFAPDQQLQGDWGDRYRQSLAIQNGADQQFQQAHPNVNLAGRIVGGIAGSIPLASAAVPARLAQATGAGGLLGRAAALGLEGAAVGADDAFTRGQNIGQGAAWGGAAGAGGSLAGDALGAIARALTSTPQSRAVPIVRQLAESDGLTTESAQTRLDQLGSAGVLADLGPNLQQGARAVASAPGAAQKNMAQALADRSGLAGARVEDAMTAAMGPRSNVLDAADQIAAQRAAQARPLYDQAYASEVPMTDDLSALLARPSMARAFTNAQKLAADAGQAIDPTKPTVMALDYTKRALDDSISSNLRAGNNNEARILMNNRDALLAHMDDAVPEYAQARKVFSDYSSVANALQEGQKVFSNATTPEMLTRQLDGMGDAERQAFQQGARQQVVQMMGTARNDANAAKSLMDKGFNREKLSLLLSDQASSDLSNAIDAERTFSATANAVRGGSMTDRNLLAQQIIPGAQSTPFLRSLMNLRMGDALASLGEKATGQILNARNEATRAEVARALLSRDASLFMPAAPEAPISPDIAGALVGGLSPSINGSRVPVRPVSPEAR